MKNGYEIQLANISAQLSAYKRIMRIEGIDVGNEKYRPIFVDELKALETNISRIEESSKNSKLFESSLNRQAKTI
ncbi:MAG: hypothetical protein LBI17_02040 [Rickettsiales bacterium]|nr:hypothetical protein [Rickettsiales bacterium]